MVNWGNPACVVVCWLNWLRRWSCLRGKEERVQRQVTQHHLNYTGVSREGQKQKRRQRQADELVELVWEKDEIVMRRPLPFPTTTTAQVVKRPKYLLSTSSTPSPPHHRNDLPFGLFPDHQLMYHHRLIQSVDHNTFNDDVSKNKKISPIKTPSPLPVPGDSHIVPDNDHEQHESAAHHIIHNSQVLGGNYFTSGDDSDEKNPTTTKQRQVETPIPIVRPFAHHDRVKVNSRQASDVQINENNCELKTSTNNSTRGAAGLLNFVTTTNFSSSSTSRSAHHQLLDGRPAVVASTAMNSTPLLPKTKPKPKISTSTTAVKPPPNLDYDNPIAVLVPDYDIDDHHRSQADPSFASKSKQNHSSAPNYTYSGATAMRKQVTDNKSYACCDEALVPSFSVCSNDPNTATHDEDDSEPCPCINKLSIEDEPQLRPPPSTSNKTPLKAATRKGPATALHNLSERRRRDKINKKMRALQALIPNCNKVKKASILDDAITYMKTLQLQLQMMSMGTAAGVMPPNPMMLAGNGAPPHLRTSFALPPPPPTFQMLGFAPTAAAASFVPVNLAPSLPLVPPFISLSLSSSKNSNPPHLKHDHRSKSNPNFLG